MLVSLSMDTTYAATLVALLIFLASVISMEAALSAAVIEIGAGVIAGNFLGLHSAPWMDFLAGLGGILLTFFAGAEVDPQILRLGTLWPQISTPYESAASWGLHDGGFGDR